MSGARRRVLAAALLATLWGCRRRPPPTPTTPREQPTAPLTGCDRLSLGEEREIGGGVDGQAEGVAAIAVSGGVLLAWLDHPEAGGAFVAARMLDPQGVPAGPARRVIELAPPPAAAAPPSLASSAGRAWVLGWDERDGCRVAPWDGADGSRPVSPQALGREVCMLLAGGGATELSFLRPFPDGWRGVPVGPGAPSGPVVAPAGERWLARADDGVVAYSETTPRVLRLRRPGQPEADFRVELPGELRALSLARTAAGYVLAWSHAAAPGTHVQRLDADLRPRGEPEHYREGGAGVALGAVGDETWVATGDPSGAVVVLRLRSGELRPAADAMRPAVRGVALAPTPRGAILAYVGGTPARGAVYALAVRCEEGPGPALPR